MVCKRVILVVGFSVISLSFGVGVEDKAFRGKRFLLEYLVVVLLNEKLILYLGFGVFYVVLAVERGRGRCFELE